MNVSVVAHPFPYRRDLYRWTNESYSHGNGILMLVYLSVQVCDGQGYECQHHSSSISLL